MTAHPKIERASEFARHAHATQTRRGGEPYYNHVARVAELVASHTQDIDMICAAFLHDTMEDCGVTHAELVAQFGGTVADLVQELTNDDTQLEAHGKENYMVNKFLHLSARAALIKLCDTLNNMSETDRETQASTYARIQRRLQQSPPPYWLDVHAALSTEILSIFDSKFPNP